MHAAHMMAFDMKLIRAEGSDHSYVSRMFLLENPICQGGFGIIIIHRHCHLGNDRAIVQSRPYEMDGAACHLDTGFHSLPLGMEPAKAGKKGWMNIDNPVWKSMNQVFPADPHISCQADEVGLIGFSCFQDGIIESCLIFKRFQFQHSGRNAPSLRPFEYLGIGMVTDNAYHSSIHSAIYGGFMDSFRVGSST